MLSAHTEPLSGKSDTWMLANWLVVRFGALCIEQQARCSLSGEHCSSLVPAGAESVPHSLRAASRIHCRCASRNNPLMLLEGGHTRGRGHKPRSHAQIVGM